MTGAGEQTTGTAPRYGLGTTVAKPYDEAVAAVRESLGEQGFGVLTEIDLAATLKAKLDVDIPPQVILGACRPPLAHQAVQVEPSIGLLLPCNVVVRSLDADSTAVEVADPHTLVAITENENLQDVADEARARLEAALSSLSN